MPTKNALSNPLAFRQSAIIPAGVAHCAGLDDVGVVVDEVGVEDVVVDEVDVVVDEVVVEDVVVDEVEVVVEEVVVEEVVVVDGATTASVKAWVALPASFAAFKANLIVPGFWGEPTSTGTPLLVLICSGEGKWGHCEQACPLQGPTMLILAVGIPLAITGNSKSV
ncbi:MAG: hypothetical protein ACLQVK_22155 [Acidimicrobiales bacterium]